MNSSIEHETTLTVGHSPRRAWLLLPLVIACFGLSPVIQAVSPEPDGGYTGANTAEGTNALFSLTSGVWNTALGYQTLYHATTGNQNTATGFQALFSATTGSLSVANGAQALYSNTTGSFNVATGFRTLYNNTSGSNNTGNGFEALNSNTTGHDNLATGFKALYINTTGSYNTATGSQALYSNISGNYNMANGQQALYSNTVGYQNTANGVQALFRNTTGFNNTAYGFQALAFNTSGQINTAIGFNALFNNTGTGNTALGQAAGFLLTTGGNNIDIGNEGAPAESDTIRIGDTQTVTFIAGIRGITTGIADAVPVMIDSAGQLGTMSSSQRFKKEIKPMEQASEAILSLQPVTFQYKSDPTGRAQFGLIAEEVAKVNPALVVRDAKGEIYSVRYDAVNAMLLNEFLKEHRTVQEQQKEIKALAAQLREQAALLQKVSDRLELSKPAPPMVVNN